MSLISAINAKDKCVPGDNDSGDYFTAGMNKDPEINTEAGVLKKLSLAG